MTTRLLTADRLSVYLAIDAECDRQAPKFHNDGDGIKLAVLTQEVGEVGCALREYDPRELRAELVQVAAVATAWIEALDSEAKHAKDLYG